MNPLRGEAALTAGGETFGIVMDVNALILAEDALDLDLSSILATFTGRNAKIRLGVVRALLWAGLQHLASPPNLLRAGEIISTAGIAEARAAVMKAVAAAMPKAAPEGDKASEEGPLKAAGGTGNDSSGAGAV